MWSIIIGILLIIAALSGQFVDKLSGSKEGLLIFGGIGVIWGIIRVIRKNRQP